MAKSPSEGLRRYYEDNPDAAITNGRRMNTARRTKFVKLVCNWCWDDFDAYHRVTRSCNNCTIIDRWDYRLRKMYGVGFRWYQEQFLIQDGRCAICNGYQTVKGRALVVDHCHSSSNVRALLCDSCNLAIGKMKENPELLRTAADYLELFAPVAEEETKKW